MKPLASMDRADGPRRARVAPQRTTTSDVTRPRAMLVAALAAAIATAVAIALVPPKNGFTSPGPLQRPHVQAKLECASCHKENLASAASACVGCHAAHPSTRPAHRALAAKGSLGCVSCHAAHGDAQGVTWLPGGSALRWGAGEEKLVDVTPSAAPSPPARTTVPLVSIAACARCHDPSRESDPIAACLSRAAPKVSVCFDEHERLDAPLAASGACKAQHSPSRFVAWEAAREAAARVPWVRANEERHLPWTWALSGMFAAMLGFVMVVAARRIRPIVSARAPGLASAPAPAPKRVRLPVIDPSTCLGCYACVDACPFDVLEIERYVAKVARPDDCCGVVLCQQVCPNGSLRIDERDATSARSADGARDDRAKAPRVDAHLESADAPGIFLAGDLTGMPLIKNAIKQGASVATRIAATLTKRERARHDVDVIVVGAGPAGLSAALRAKELGLRCVVLEQATVAASIKSFPRHKLVYDPPLDVPLEGPLWLRAATKEELLAQWSRLVRAHALEVREHHAVRDVRREGGDIVVVADHEGASRELRAARLVLAIGRRGSPRKLDAVIAPDAEAHVSYALADVRSFEKQRVLVVGLGDAAMEAACALARQPGTVVTISYRGKYFQRGKARNIGETKDLVRAGRLRIVFDSRVARVDVGRVTLATARGTETIAADAVVALIGGVPSWSLVEAAGVRIDAPTTKIADSAPPPDGPAASK